jgi:putative SOS response-associated peptidase YedK
MARTFDSPRHAALREFLVRKRKEAGLRQVDLAKRLKRRQDYVSYVETGQKLVEVVARPDLQPILARAKTISEMKMFRDTYRKRRCIVPISSFFRRTRRRSVRLSTDAP